MTVNVKCGEIVEEIVCPEGTFFAGIELPLEYNNVSISNSTDAITSAIFPGTKCEKIEKVLPSGMKFALFFYTSDDPAYEKLYASYAGMKIMEIDADGIEITMNV